MAAWGTLTIQDLLSSTSQVVGADFDEEMIFEIFSDYLDAWNTRVADQLDELSQPTTDRLVGQGGVQAMEAVDIDEMGTPPAQKVTAGQTMGFPLRNHGVTLQWTRLSMMARPVSVMAAQFMAAVAADRAKVQSRLQKALYGSANYNFVDIRTEDRPTLPVKRLANADGWGLPVGPNGEVFDGSTHTHYLANATLDAATLSANVLTVAEHYSQGDIRIVINQAQESTVRGLTGFDRLYDDRIAVGSTLTYMRGGLEPTDRYNRLIGLYDGAEVWIKPWAIANYVVSYNRSAPKILGRRVRNAQSGNFVMTYEDEVHPLRCRTMEREMDFGVRNRVGAAITYIGGGSYVVPTIA